MIGFHFLVTLFTIQIGTLIVEIRPKESIWVFVEPFKLLRQVLVASSPLYAFTSQCL
jgi:hypothetical protein